MKPEGLLFSITVGVLLIVFSVDVSPLLAQSTGSMTGIVANSSAAPVPEAIVTLLNAATNQNQTTASGVDGRFGFPTLAPGSYSLLFSAKGFKTSSVASVTVNVSESTVVEAKLEAGDTAQTVPCQCSVAHATSSSGEVMDSKAVTSVPLTSRNMTQVLGSAAGSSSSVTNAGLLGNRNQTVNVLGSPIANNINLDGAVAASVPNPDTISQFRIQTSQYDAGYGAHVPTTNLLTKSGANDIHGAVWEFVRNNIFNANEFFLKAAGQPRPDLKQNQYGIAVGGPIKKDKLFFFGSYQATRQVNGLDPSSLSTILQPPLTDDRSAETIGLQFCSSPTFAQGEQVACNGSNINPVALKILEMQLPDGSYLIPTPQKILTSGVNAGLGSSTYSRSGWYNDGHYAFNLDYAISKKHTLAGRFYFSHFKQLKPFGAGFGVRDPKFVPGAPMESTARDYSTSVQLSSVLTSNLVNEVRAAFSTTGQVNSAPGIPTATSLGMIPVDPSFNEAPSITVQGLFQVFGNVESDRTERTDSLLWADNLSWSRGRHTIRTGVFVDTIMQKVLPTGQARGRIIFQTFSDFLLGKSAAANSSPQGLSNVDSVSASLGTGPRGEVQYRYRSYSGAAFVQDDVKLTPRITLNLGLRWEYVAPSRDTAGEMGNVWPSLISLLPVPPLSGTYVGQTVTENYNPDAINPYTGLAFGPVPAGVLIHANNSPYQNGVPLNNFAPRFGFAWQPGSKQGRLIVRGGYGWLYQRSDTPMLTSQPFAQAFGNTGASNSLSTFQQPFPVATLGFRLRTPTSRLSDSVSGPDFRVPMIQQWNLTMQIALLRTLSLDVGYAGSRGRNLPLSSGLGSNQPLLASVSNPVNCGYNGGDPNNLANCITTNTSQNAALRVPFMGETPTALAATSYIGHSVYNGLQTTLRKQFSRGLTFQVSYTYSKAMSDTTPVNDQTNRLDDWARLSFDRTHRLVFSYNYAVPNPVGSDHKYVASILNGWSISGVTSIQSGQPLTLTDRASASIYGRAGTSTITFCPGMTKRDIGASGSNQERLNGWFNLAAIRSSLPSSSCQGPAPSGYGNAGQGIISGPGQNDWDLSIGKATRVGGIREDAELQFRTEFYNLFNHPQFSNPGTTLGTANFGVITQTTVAPRLIQFGLKYIF